MSNKIYQAPIAELLDLRFDRALADASIGDDWTVQEEETF